ncbi:MAG: SOUL family heme-binding protein [Bdellovibrio bacteriovorus]
MKILLIVLGVLLLLGVAALAVFVFVVQNVEQPSYRVVERQGDLEIRDYPSLIQAQIRRQGARKEALRSGFGPLARYIFGKERAGEPIAMTAPVTQRPVETIAMTAPVTQTRDGRDDWAVSFIMPARYRLDELPVPAGDVRLVEVPARRVGAIRFSGRASDAEIAGKESELRAWLAKRGVSPEGPPLYAYYNDPLTPGFLRRNEVLLDLAAERAPGISP